MRTAALPLVAMLAGCGLVTGLSALEKVDCLDCAPPGDDTDSEGPGDPRPPADAAPQDEASPPTSTPDSGAPAEDSAPPDAGMPCPGTEGPVAVRITAGGASYCVDRTEVTNAQYARFVAARNNALGLMDQDPHCAWNGSYVPTSWPYPAGREGYPVANVDWCDAYAFCKWAGKRLCGRIGGGRVARSDGIDATRSQWYAACSASGARVYPYGNTYVAASCNGEDVSGNALRPAGSSPACAGGASPELLDLSGNVWEWEDSCSAYTMAGGAIERCETRGGGYQSPATNLRCVSRGDRNRDDGNGDTGFRCCGP